MFTRIILFSSALVFATIALSIEDRDKIFAQAVGPCIDDRCQTKHECFYGQCVPQGIAPAMRELKEENSIGPCMNGGMCPGDNFCHKAKCYPME